MPAQDIDAPVLRILLVEDNADDAALLERHLRRAGLHAVLNRVETGAEFRSALDSVVLPAIVVADYNLPAFSGPEALTLLRASGSDIPFIMMSGAMSEEAAVSSMRAGAQDYVTKQNLARLVPALERELREAAARRSRRAAEAALRASEDRFHCLIEAMPVGLLLGGPGGRIAYANAAAGTLLGSTAQDLLAGTATLQQLGIQQEGEIPGENAREVPFQQSGGNVIQLLVASAYLTPGNAADPRQTAVFLVDITQQKHSEEALRRTEKLAVAGRFAASIAHEINNPLAAVTNCLFLVANTELTGDGRAFLEMAQQELSRVSQITVQTLRFHRQSTRPALCDVRELADTVIALFESRFRQQHITMQRDYGEIQPLLAYEGEIRQVLVNLLGNAIDASNGGDIILRIRQIQLPHQGCEGIVFHVADRGTGIAPDALGHLFEPFFSTKGITGTGLGLWVSQEIVQRHGGTIRVHSRRRTGQQAGGTVFRVFLPLGGVPTPAPDRSAVS